jgi:hypothetical protein
VIHVYGIVEDLAALPAQPGVDDAPLERRRVGELELVVSRVGEQLSPQVTQEAVLRHAEVVEELMSRSRAVLPVRFGEFGDEAELETAVSGKTRELEQGLRRVRGCVEFGLRAVGPAVSYEAAAEASSGAEYMRSRLVEEKRREQLVTALHEPLARLSRAAVSPRVSGNAFQSAYLVPATEVDAFREAVRRLQAADPGLTLVCTGPWPPYSFTGSGEES